MAAAHRLADDAGGHRRARSRGSSSSITGGGARCSARRLRTGDTPTVARPVDRLRRAAARARVARLPRRGSIASSTDHTIFAGVTYTDAHVTLTGHAGRRRARSSSAPPSRSSTPSSAPKLRWLVAAVVPAVVCYVVVGLLATGTSTASSSSRTSWCASRRTSRTTSR